MRDVNDVGWEGCGHAEGVSGGQAGWPGLAGAGGLEGGGDVGLVALVLRERAAPLGRLGGQQPALEVAADAGSPRVAM